MKGSLPILYEDDFLFAVNKSARMASVPAEKNPLQKTALGLTERHFQAAGFKPYILHRLDYETSGVLLFGKFRRDRQALEGIFQASGTCKKYLVLVKGIPHGKAVTKLLEARESGGKIPARTDYKVLTIIQAPHPSLALVEAEIKTGRKHQIRKHFAAIGHPVIMDARYGDFHVNRRFRMRYRLGRLFLHAAQIEFLHPLLHKKIRIEAPLPMDLKATLKKLGARPPQA